MWSLITVMAFMGCSLYTRFGPLHTVVMSMVSNQDAPQPYSDWGRITSLLCLSVQMRKAQTLAEIYLRVSQ